VTLMDRKRLGILGIELNQLLRSDLLEQWRPAGHRAGEIMIYPAAGGQNELVFLIRRLRDVPDDRRIERLPLLLGHRYRMEQDGLEHRLVRRRRERSPRMEDRRAGMVLRRTRPEQAGPVVQSGIAHAG